MIDLTTLGWTPAFQFHFDELDAPELRPARLSGVDRGLFDLLTADGERRGRLPGHSADPETLPVVGDWCAYAPGHDPVSICHTLPRRTQISRMAAGRATRAQLLAANVDLALIVTGLDGDFSPRRIERFAVLCREGGVRPAVVLNKVDLCAAVQARREEAEQAAAGSPVHVVSAQRGDGLAELRATIAPGQTAVLLGSSGVGKSTLINYLLGDPQLPTAPVRERDGRGQHTTTRRELVRLPDGGLLIDMPGLREVGLWADEAAVAEGFADIAALAQDCRFVDCEHQSEPDCAVKAALEAGRLDAARWQSYQQLLKEARSTALRRDEHQRRQHERQTIGKYRQWLKEKRRLD